MYTFVQQRGGGSRRDPNHKSMYKCAYMYVHLSLSNMTFVDVTVGISVIYFIPNNWLIKYKVRFLPIDVFSFILFRA